MTNQNTVTQHVWASRVPELNHPDLCVFDLDPSRDDAAAVRAAAIGLRDLLEELALPSWIKTSARRASTSSFRLTATRRSDSWRALPMPWERCS